MRRRAVVLLCFLLATGVAVHTGREVAASRPTQSLRDAVGTLPGWESAPEVLGEDVRRALDVDDYLFQSYRRGGDSVGLYVGYYYTRKKLGAVHSPLVCFPGQGWETSRPRAVTVELPGGGGVYASAITVGRGDLKALVVYWYQACDRPVRDTLQEKIWTTYSRLVLKREANAFVRITVPLDEGERHAYETAVAFVRDFYPVFHRYVVGG